MPVVLLRRKKIAPLSSTLLGIGSWFMKKGGKDGIWFKAAGYRVMAITWTLSMIRSQNLLKVSPPWPCFRLTFTNYHEICEKGQMTETNPQESANLWKTVSVSLYHCTVYQYLAIYVNGLVAIWIRFTESNKHYCVGSLWLRNILLKRNIANLVFI